MVALRHKNRHQVKPLVAFAGVLFLSACPDPQAKFEDFDKTVIDAAGDHDAGIDARALSSIPDLTGRHHVGYAVFFAPDFPLQFVIDVEMTRLPVGAEMDVTFHILTVDGRQPARSPVLVEKTPINAAGEFELDIGVVMFPGEANPISGADITGQFFMGGTITEPDFWCGDVWGPLTQPSSIDLEGSTFGAVRVADDAIGDALPDPVIAKCPERLPPDAGVPDAGPALDAKTNTAPDAAVSEAGTPDAST